MAGFFDEIRSTVIVYTATVISDKFRFSADLKKIKAEVRQMMTSFFLIFVK